MYLKPIQTSKMKAFVKIVNDLIPLTIFTKSSILDVWLVSKTSTKSFKSFCEFNFISFIKGTLMQIWKSPYMFVLIQKQNSENFPF